MPSHQEPETLEQLRDRLSRALWKSLRTLNLQEPPKLLVQMDQGLVDRAFTGLCERLDGPEFKGWDETFPDDPPRSAAEEFAAAIKEATDEIEAEELYPDLERDIEAHRQREKIRLITVLMATAEGLSDFGMAYDDLANCIAMSLNAAHNGMIHRFMDHCRTFRTGDHR